jgi:hypothetical protein
MNRDRLTKLNMFSIFIGNYQLTIFMQFGFGAIVAMATKNLRFLDFFCQGFTKRSWHAPSLD